MAALSQSSLERSEAGDWSGLVHPPPASWRPAQTGGGGGAGGHRHCHQSPPWQRGDPDSHTPAPAVLGWAFMSLSWFGLGTAPPSFKKASLYRGPGVLSLLVPGHRTGSHSIPFLIYRDWSRSGQWTRARPFGMFPSDLVHEGWEWQGDSSFRSWDVKVNTWSCWEPLSPTLQKTPAWQ